MTPDEIVWVDEDAPAREPDEELPDGDRPGMRTRTRLLLGVAVALVLGAAVTVAVVGGGDESRPVATRTVAPIRSSERTFAVEPPALLNPPSPIRAAIHAAFPAAEVTSFVTAVSPGTDGTPARFYNARDRERTLTVSVRPTRRSDREAVNRTANSVEIVQLVGRRTVGVLLRADHGPTSAADFARVQQLVGDTRLLSAG